MKSSFMKTIIRNPVNMIKYNGIKLRMNIRAKTHPRNLKNKTKKTHMKATGSINLMATEKQECTNRNVSCESSQENNLKII